MAISFTPITFKNTIDGGPNLDTNFSRIQTALTGALSRSSSTNNEMGVDLDMNGNRVLNVAEPLASSDAARLADIQAALSGGAANLISFTPYDFITSDNVQGAVQNVVDKVNELETDTANAILHVDSVADLLNLPTGELYNDQIVRVKEYVSGTGVGGGDFYWDANSSEADDSGTIFQVGTVDPGRWKRIFSGKINIQWFGAVPDDSTDASAAIQSAIAYALSTDRERTVYAPQGIYRLGSTITILESRLYIEGDGQQSTRLHLDSGIGIGIDIGDGVSPLEQLGFTGLTMRGNGSGDSNTYLIRARFCQKTCFFQDIEFNFSDATGLWMDQCWGTRVERCHFYFVGDGAYFEDFNDGVISSNYFWNNSKTNLKLVDGSASTINGNAFESWGQANPSLYDNILLTNHKSCSFFGNWLETALAAGSAFVSDGTSERLQFSNNVVFGSSLVNHLVQIGGESSYVGRNRLAINNASFTHIRLQAAATRTRLDENSYEGSSSTLQDLTSGEYFRNDRITYRASASQAVSLASGASTAFNVTVTGAAVGDFVDVSGSTNMLDVLVQGSVGASDTVRVTLFNAANISRDLGTVTFRVMVTKKDF